LSTELNSFRFDSPEVAGKDPALVCLAALSPFDLCPAPLSFSQDDNLSDLKDAYAPILPSWSRKNRKLGPENDAEMSECFRAGL
jgi:hypothetical protein